MEPRLIERLFEELDKNTKRVEDMSKIVYENSATLTLMVRLVIGIILFLIAFTVGIIGNNVTTKKKQQDMTVGTINEIVDKKSLIVQKKILNSIRVELEEHNNREENYLNELKNQYTSTKKGCVTEVR